MNDRCSWCGTDVESATATARTRWPAAGAGSSAGWSTSSPGRSAAPTGSRCPRAATRGPTRWSTSARTAARRWKRPTRLLVRARGDTACPTASAASSTCWRGPRPAAATATSAARVGAGLGPVAADLHRAPGARAVSRRVVERPVAVLRRAGLQARPGSGGLRLDHDRQQPAQRRGDARAERLELQPAGFPDAHAQRRVAGRRRRAAPPRRRCWPAAAPALASRSSIARSRSARVHAASEPASPCSASQPPSASGVAGSALTKRSTSARRPGAPITGLEL